MAIFSNIVQGEWGDPYGGLLDEQDRRNGLKQGLQGFGAAALGQGYSRVPQSGFEGIGQGIANFQQARDKALRQSLEMKLLNRQMGREDVKDARDTERFGMEKQNFDLAKSKAERDARRDDANFNETDRVRQAQSNLAKVLAARAAAGDRNPSAHPDVISALAQVDGLKGMGALQQEQPLTPEIEAQRIRMQQAGQLLSPAAEAQRTRMAQETQRPRLMSPEEEAQQIRITGARAQAMQQAKPLRDVPATAATGMLENVASLEKIDRALTALDGYKEGTGLARGAMNAVIPSMLDRYDPKGVNVRSLIADIGSMKIHDRSGAAVSVAEFPRLRPFVPQVSDDAETIKTKLKNFRVEYANMLQAQSEVYGEDGGFKPMPPVQRALSGQQPVAPASAAQPSVSSLPPDAQALVNKYIKAPQTSVTVPIR